MAVFSGPEIANTGLIFCVDAANIKSYPGSGTTWFDVSGQGRHLTIYGSPTWNPQGYFTLANNQTTQYMMVVPFEISTTSISLSCWFRSNFINPNQTPFTYSVNGDNTFLLYTDSSTSIVPHDVNDRYPITVSDMQNRWCNFTWTRESASGSSVYYMNGVLVGSRTALAGTSPVSGGHLIIGQEADSSGGTFDPAQNLDGDFARLDVYNRVLNAGEVAQNFNAMRSRFGI